MEVKFAAKLQKVIGNEAQHLKKRAGQLSKSIKLRIDQIRAATNYLEYQSIGLGKPHLLDGDFAGCFAVSVSKNCRLIGRLCVEDLSLESLEKCDKVVIEGVVDYHGKGNNWIIP